jgi:hypothetical protein
MLDAGAIAKGCNADPFSLSRGDWQVHHEKQNEFVAVLKEFYSNSVLL